jgi:hypothetical protein
VRWYIVHSPATDAGGRTFVRDSDEHEASAARSAAMIGKASMRALTCALTFIVIVPSACSHRSVTATTGVAIIGDSEAEMRRGIGTAQDVRRNPLFASIAWNGRIHVFSPYAQILRSGDEIVVRAYDKLYVFPAGSAVTYAGRAVPLAALPSIDPRGLDGLTGSDPSGVVEFDARGLGATTDGWNGLHDPWQRAVLTPWTKGAAQTAQIEVEPAP